VADVAVGDDADERAVSVQHRQVTHLSAAHPLDRFRARLGIADRDDVSAHELADSHA
jgi:hypothetical protein